ncbi:hypothetical protein PEC18_21270 [Paucibacter sp. O1-1]|nr:hypothetical protein [Paucibacter sp. O1-1]MDA3828284.1 hypothetical protein [Paucibacter sp. O1-1]
MSAPVFATRFAAQRAALATPLQSCACRAQAAAAQHAQPAAPL